MWPIIPLLALSAQQAQVPEDAGPATAPEWPARVPLEILRPLEISYPPRALRRGLEGGVTAEVLVGRDGVPRDCRIAASSGHPVLDAETCSMFLQARFAPPRGARGENVETSFAQRVMWVLPERRRRAFEPSSMSIEFGIEQSEVTACAASGDGPLFADWRKFACSFAVHVARRIGEAGLAAAQAEVRVSMAPAGSAGAAPPPSSGSIGRQQLEFELSESRVTGCRMRIAGQSGTVSFPERQLCYLFVSDSFRFERPQDPREIRRGTFTIEILQRGAQKPLSRVVAGAALPDGGPRSPAAGVPGPRSLAENRKRP